MYTVNGTQYEGDEIVDAAEETIAKLHSCVTTIENGKDLDSTQLDFIAKIFKAVDA